MTPAERHAELCQRIAHHDHLYYVRNAPEISDRDYDALFAELKQLEHDHPQLVHPDSPTQRVGEQPRAGVAKVEHAHPMYSLDNTYNEGELREFDRRVREALGEQAFAYVAEPKIDGASLEVVYDGGKLVLGATRGDGRVGEDVTQNVRAIRAVPLTIADKRKLTLRGEVIIYRKDLDATNARRVEKGEEPFANPRNAAAGALRLMDAREAAARNLRVFFYDIVERHYDTHHEVLEALSALGLPTHGKQRVCADMAEVLAFIADFDRERRALPYETDGVVLKVDSLEQRKQLGTTTRFPRWAIAYKYEAERAFTIVRKIVTDLGRTGQLTPVAELDPVHLSGTVVSRASLHNIDYVREKDVRIGDTVQVEKAGEIIPQVLSVSHDLRPGNAEEWQPPTHCPACGTAVKREEDEAALRCPNTRCPGRVKAGIFYFTRRGAMDVDRLGRALIEQLVDKGVLKTPADVFALTREQLLALERMADKSADNVMAAIEEARTKRTLSRLVTGLGIPHVGTVAARAIAERFRTLPALIEVADKPEHVREELAKIRGVGPTIADSAATFLADEDTRQVLHRMIDLGVVADEPELPPAEGPLVGSSFCVTGTLSQPREAIHAAIRNAGGEIHNSVGKNTTYLVAGANVGKSKLTAAEKRGTKVIDEAELARMIGTA
jgi:DNA ligase (NAD+)